MSIIPGIENLAPERTETRSGLAGSPKPLPVRRSTSLTASRTSCQRPSGSCSPAAKKSLHASVVIVKPGGTGRPGDRHLREAGALAAEQVAHRRAAFRPSAAPGIDVALGGEVGAVGRGGLGHRAGGSFRRRSGRAGRVQRIVPVDSAGLRLWIGCGSVPERGARARAAGAVRPARRGGSAGTARPGRCSIPRLTLAGRLDGAETQPAGSERLAAASSLSTISARWARRELAARLRDPESGRFYPLAKVSRGIRAAFAGI